MLTASPTDVRGCQEIVTNHEAKADVSTRSFWQRWRPQLSRVTSTGRYIPAVDGLRFVAILGVLLFHVQESLIVKLPHLESPARQTWLFHLLKVGNVGVPLFFTLSGFILTLPFLEAFREQKALPLRRYFLRRLTRLEPPYIVNLLLVTALLVCVRGDSFEELTAPLGASLLYAHNLVYGTMSRINPVAWSLEIEVQFYILAPVLALAILRSPIRIRRSILAVLILGSCLLKSFAPVAVPARLLMSLPWHLDHFLAGMLLADIYATDWKESPDQSYHWDILGLAAWIGLLATQMNPSVRYWMPPLTILAYMSSFRGAMLNRLLSHPFLTITGGMCYTLYLYHFYVISFVSRFTIPRLRHWDYLPALLGQLTIIVPATLLLGAVLFVAIERPCMNWRPRQRRTEQGSEDHSSVVLERVAAS